MVSPSSPMMDYSNLQHVEDYSIGVVQTHPHHQPVALCTNASQPNVLGNRSETPRSDLSSAREHMSLTSGSSRDSLRSSVVNSATNSLPSHSATADSVEPSTAVKRVPPVPPKRHTRRDELNEQLDRLEQKGIAMTEEDRRTYRELVNELAKIRLPSPSASLESKPAASRFVTQQDHGSSEKRQPEVSQFSAKSKDAVEQPRKFYNLKEEMKLSDSNAAMADFGDQDELEANASDKVHATSDQEHADSSFETQKHDGQTSGVTTSKTDSAVASSIVPCKTEDAETPSAAPSKTTPPLSKESSELKKKSVQWHDANELKTEEAEDPRKLIYEDEEKPGPRVQVLGAQEIYRDPRQRRLEEMRVRQIAATNKIDGAQLGFRDKMQLFAEQIGEKTVKNRYKASAVQREIEQTMTDDS